MPISRATGLVSVLGFAAALMFAVIFQHETWLQPTWLRDPQIGPPNRVIAIELGRSYNRVAAFRNHSFEMILDNQGRSTIPFYIALPELRTPLDGFEAKNQADGGPNITIHDLGLLLGRRRYNSEFEADIKTLSYSVMAEDGRTFFRLHVNGTDKYFTPEEILSYPLANLKAMAEAHLNQTVTSAVIAVPSYFNETQKQVVRRAAEIAGLEVSCFYAESVAAGIAYNVDTMVTRRGKGEDDVPDHFLILNLGEEELSIAVESVLRGVFRTAALVDDRAFQGNDFQNLSNHHEKERSRILALVEHVLEVSLIDRGSIKAIVVAGDSESQMKACTPVVESFFPGKKVLAAKEFERDKAVIYGASLQAYKLSEDYEGELRHPMDVTPWSLGIETQEGIFSRVISQNVAIPTARSCVVTTTRHNQKKVVIKVWEGESLVASQNNLLGSLELDGLPERPEAEIEIKVRFEVDDWGTLTVTATESKSKKAVQLVKLLDLDQDTRDEADMIKLKAEPEASDDDDAALLNKRSMTAQAVRDYLEFRVALKQC